MSRQEVAVIPATTNETDDGESAIFLTPEALVQESNLRDEITDDASVIDAHSGTVSVENSGNSDLHDKSTMHQIGI